jgi:hypothetical protein
MAGLLALAVLVVLAGSENAWATTCSQRHQECFRNCARLFPNRPACTVQCADTLPRCMSTGCWINKMANKCGYIRR